MSRLTDLFLDRGIGGGIPFTVTRVTVTRENGEETESTETLTGIGLVNILSLETLRAEDAEEKHENRLKLYTTLPMRAGRDDGGAVYTKPDRFTLGGREWRVAGTEDRSGEGFNIVTAVERI